MSSTILEDDYYNDDEINDNMSDEDEWSQETENIGLRCPDIYPLGYYYQPERFNEKCAIYGDGGYVDLIYPIWIFDALSTSFDDKDVSVREELLKTFYELNDERKDFHQHPSPVEDIIDPDLLPYKPTGYSLPVYLRCHDYHAKGEFEKHDPVVQETTNYSLLRDTYQWIPSEFRIVHGETCTVHIETPINHLPMTEQYTNTYRNLEKLFCKLVPMFGEIIDFNKTNGDTRLQVVVKVQSYNIQSGKLTYRLSNNN